MVEETLALAAATAAETIVDTSSRPPLPLSAAAAGDAPPPPDDHVVYAMAWCVRTRYGTGTMVKLYRRIYHRIYMS